MPRLAAVTNVTGTVMACCLASVNVGVTAPVGLPLAVAVAPKPSLIDDCTAKLKAPEKAGIRGFPVPLRHCDMWIASSNCRPEL